MRSSRIPKEIVSSLGISLENDCIKKLASLCLEKKPIPESLAVDVVTALAFYIQSEHNDVLVQKSVETSKILGEGYFYLFLTVEEMAAAYCTPGQKLETCFNFTPSYAIKYSEQLRQRVGPLLVRSEIGKSVPLLIELITDVKTSACSYYKLLLKSDKADTKFNIRTCGSCSKGDCTQRCASCKSIYYCSKTCQNSHWKNGHKALCKVIQENKEFTAQLNEFKTFLDSRKGRARKIK